MKPVERSAALTGLRFGLLKALREDTETTRNRNRRWWCRCRCGRITSVIRPNLITGHTRSCGCLRQQPRQHIPNDLQETTHDAR